MRSTKLIMGLVALLGVAACGEESPVELDDLMPGGGIRTQEAFFDGSQILEWDSVRTGFVRPRDLEYFIAANEFEGELDANTLLRFEPLPRTISYQGPEGRIVTDSLPDRVGGRLILELDSKGVRGGGEDGVTLSLYNVAEDWDLSSASWTMRIDSGTVHQSWDTPGGDKLRLIGTAELGPDDSELEFQVDSTAIRLLADPDLRSRGLLVGSETPGTMVQFSNARLRFDTRPRQLPDTLISGSVELSSKTFLLSQEPDPDLDPLAPLYIGGVPASRSYLHFKSGLDSLRVPCPDGPPGCMIELRDVSINYASLGFKALAGRAGFNLQDTTVLEPRTVLPIEGVPLIRSPLGIQLTSGVRVLPESVVGADDRVEVPVTMLISAMTAHNDSIRANAPRTISLLRQPEGTGFGVTAFGSLESGADLAPRLKLIYSVTKEVQVQ